MKKSSENEKAVYNYMKYYFKEKGQCLTLYEISDFIGKPYSTAKRYVAKLKEKGLIKTVHSKKRFGEWEFVLL